MQFPVAEPALIWGLSSPGGRVPARAPRQPAPTKNWIRWSEALTADRMAASIQPVDGTLAIRPS